MGTRVRDDHGKWANPIDDLARIFRPPPVRLITGPPGPTSQMTRHYRDPFYLAEIEARSTAKDRMLTGPEIQAYVNEVTAMSWPHWGPPATWPITIRILPTSAPYYNSGVITVPSPIRELIVLHEIAHQFAGVRTGGMHDLTFIRAFLDLIAGVRNPAQAEHFRDIFAKYKVAT
jgi:putative metallohydrolase (TIGR04338 family)